MSALKLLFLSKQTSVISITIVWFNLRVVDHIDNSWPFWYKQKAQINFSGPWQNVCASWQSCICKFTKTYPTQPYLRKVSIPCPNPAGGSLDVAQPGATFPQPLAQTFGRAKVDFFPNESITMDYGTFFHPIRSLTLQILYSCIEKKIANIYNDFH